MHHIIRWDGPILECLGVEFFPERTGLELRIVISEGCVATDRTSRTRDAQAGQRASCDGAAGVSPGLGYASGV